jgi:hypothetical protein
MMQIPPDTSMDQGHEKSHLAAMDSGCALRFGGLLVPFLRARQCGESVQSNIDSSYALLNDRNLDAANVNGHSRYQLRSASTQGASPCSLGPYERDAEDLRVSRQPSLISSCRLSAG